MVRCMKQGVAAVVHWPLVVGVIDHSEVPGVQVMVAVRKVNLPVAVAVSRCAVQQKILARKQSCKQMRNSLVNWVAQRHNLVHVKVRGQRLARPALLVVGSVILVALPDRVLLSISTKKHAKINK